MEAPRHLPTQALSLEARLAEAEAQLAEARETLQAIHSGEVDAVVVAGIEGDQVFTLQGAETPYRFLVEEMNEGALLLTPDGTVVFANARFAALAGLPLERVAGSAWGCFFPAAEQSRLAALLETAKRGGVREEFLLLAKGGSVRPVQLSLNSMSPERVEGYAVIVTDLTERRVAEEALQGANAKLREMVQELEHFSHSITHDMRAPLRAMHSFAGLLEEECSECSATNRPLLRRIRVAAERMDALILDSLNYVKAVREKLPLEAICLSELLQDLVETYPNLHPDSAEIEFLGKWPLVLGNPAGLTQCFANLLGNAVKFVPPGLKPHVRVWAEPMRDAEGDECRVASDEGEHPQHQASNLVSGSRHPSLDTQHSVRIWIEDNGIGIPERLQGRIFDMFERGTNEYEGTGIGLAIVRKVVQQMQGRVGVESRPGKGSRFWVELKIPRAAFTKSRRG
jgi:PAS domain S-box-containing protein